MEATVVEGVLYPPPIEVVVPVALIVHTAAVVLVGKVKEGLTAL
jgi:hypothetical protein